ncbi:hypothetical protein KEM48_001951 [Puccinia striiformis f. sp. tritici PST-130]|uniref:Uncharacterized protein n=2 Tax=Puccinia striiformis f. sp. tritici TaxID=168172 RepID=A0A0L0UR57_9BASI|nr:hypothetical protein KEM48_001951 [Puccinia striiformis f. sp. tritici PST-130]KNE89562.1 hypothetical protein PSTG_16975 [Puccinia striiformis f. sp. tritici PST-78]
MRLFLDLVISGFKGLISVIEELTGNYYSSTRSTQTNSEKKDHMTKLESRLLPQLQNQLNAILEPLVALDSPGEPCLRLQSVLDIQPQLLGCDILIKGLELSTNTRVEPEDDVSGMERIWMLDVEYSWRDSKQYSVILEYPEDLVSQINRTSDDEDKGEDEDIEDVLLPVLKSFEPVLKLSRLYLSKLTLPSMDRKLVPYCTEMSSHELQILDQLGCGISIPLGIVTERLSEIVYEAEVNEHGQSVEARLEELQDVFNSATPVVLKHFVPIIADTELQSYLREWFDTWNLQVTLAINNFMVAFNRFKLLFDQLQSNPSQSGESQSDQSESDQSPSEPN